MCNSAQDRNDVPRGKYTINKYIIECVMDNQCPVTTKKKKRKKQSLSKLGIKQKFIV